MAIKGAKTIAEYEIRKRLEKEGLVMECLRLEMIGPHEAVIRDGNGDDLRLVYDSVSRTVILLDE